MKSFTISGATIFTPTEQLSGASLYVEGQTVRQVGDLPLDGGVSNIDASGLFLVPGFVELQINGGFGHDFTAVPECIWDVGRDLPRFGVTRFLPTIVTSPPEIVARAQAVLQAGPPPGYRGAYPVGLHVEGPFLNPQRKGAHRQEHLRSPNLDFCRSFSPQEGVRLVTLAPELPGALEVVRQLSQRGIVVSASHSMATYEQSRQAFEAGVRYATHLFNTMPPVHQFEPGLVTAVLQDPDLCFGLIADGIHVHPALVDLIWKLSGPGRMTLVSDAMAALGQGPGKYRLGDQDKVIVDSVSARLPNGLLAGSILTQDAALRNLIAFTGCTMQDALTCLTSTPAALLGLENDFGRVAPGVQADFVLMTPMLEVVQTFVAGQSVYTRYQEKTAKNNG